MADKEGSALPADPARIVETVRDRYGLGSGPGLDPFLAARRVGPQGRIIGVDLAGLVRSIAFAARKPG